MPTFFVPHGAGPCFFMEWHPADTWDRMADFLRSIPGSLPEKPQAIVLVTAHWQEQQPSMSSAAQPGMIYDYRGFPAHTYELKYPAPGAPELAGQVSVLLKQAGFAPVQNPERGYDHGTFIPLKVAFPDADIPVLQLSLLESLNAADHIRLGQTLEPLRDEGVLIIGSGMSYHNMRGYGSRRSTPIAAAFDAWLTETVALPQAERNARLADWAQASGPAGRESHPNYREEHLLPLHVAAGAAGAGAGRKVFTDEVLSVAISAFRFD
ncbi:MAG: dioxygenase [Brachymonas sp.]|nr:dioxygenase [Brachymonas sp.]